MHNRNLASLVLTALFAFPLSIHAATLEAVDGHVTVRYGEKSAQSFTSSDTFPAEIPTPCRVSTDSQSKAKIRLKDQSEINLAPNTEFEINAEGTNSEPTSLSLATGKLRAWVSQQKSAQPNWKLKTPTALMGVRGTEFLADSNDDRTILCAFEGKVAVSAAVSAPRGSSHAAETEITANQGVVISQGGAITAPAKMDNHLMDWWRKETFIATRESTQTSSETLLHQLNEDWLWAGPGTVNTLNPAALYSETHKLYMNADLWAKASFSDAETSQNSNNSYFTRAKLSVKIPLNTELLVMGEGLFSAKWGSPSAEEASSAKLQQLLLLYSPGGTHTFAVGRQEWHLGDGMLIGKDPWKVVPRSFDSFFSAIRFADVRVRFLAASLGDRVSSWKFDDFVYGVYADFAKLPVDFFALGVKREGSAQLSTSESDLKAKYGIIGERAFVQLPGKTGKHFFVHEEFQYEFGSVFDVGQSQTLSAYLARAEAGGMWQAFGLNGLSKFVFTKASGDSTPADGHFNGYLQVAPDSHRFFGLVDAFGPYRDIERLGFSSKADFSILGKATQFQFDYSHFKRTGTNHNELDFILGFDPLPALHVMGGYGLLMKSPENSNRNAYLGFLMAQYRL